MDVNNRTTFKRERSPQNNDGPRRQRRVGASRFSSPRRHDPQNKCVHVSNIPFQFRWQDLKDLFRKNVGDVSFAEIFMDENQKSRGSGVVEFVSPEFVPLAIEKLHQHDVNGRKIIVRVGDSSSERQSERRGGDDMLPPLNYDMNQWGRRDIDQGPGPLDQAPQDAGIVWGETYGLSQNFLQELNIRDSLLTRVFVANLSYTVTRKKLKEVFKLAGRIVDLELQTNADGTSRGFATVEYDHPVEAVQAISMFHNQYLFERKMAVRMDRRDRNSDAVKLPEGLQAIGMGLGSNGNPLYDVTRNLHSLVGSPTPATLAAASSLGLSNAVNTQLGLLNAAPMRSQDNMFAGGQMMPANMGLQRQGQFNGSIPTPSFNNSERNDYRPSSSGIDYRPSSSSINDRGGLSYESGRFNNNNSNSSNNNNAPSHYDVHAMNKRGGTSFNMPSQGGQQGGVSDTILIKNLPLGFTPNALSELFNSFGPISFTEMHSKDVGLVRFFRDQDAEKAFLASHSQVYKDRRLHVTYQA